MVRGLVFSRVFSFFFLIIAIFILTACTAQDPSGRFRLQIVTANVLQQQSEESNKQVAERLYESGRFIAKEFPFWTFIAANELATDKLEGKIPWIGPVRFREKKLDCPYDDTGAKLVSINCVVGGLNGTDDLAHQKGEVGIIARGLLIDQLQVNGEQFVSRLIGPERNGGIQRRFIASRFRTKYTGHHVLLVSIHLNHAGSDTERKEELEDLIENIKAIYVPGDLTPILAGDFNCRTWNAEHRTVIYKDFFLATSDLNGIDHVFLGRPQSFPENGGVLVPVPNSTKSLTPTGYDGKSLSDHPYVVVDLLYDPDNQPTILPPPVTTPGNGCKSP